MKNLAASIHQRLLNQARATNRPFNELLQYYAMERFLYRLASSPYAERFVLKGGLMLATWKVSLTRPTKDIDLLGRTRNDIDEIVAVMNEVCTQEVEPDGLNFDAKNMVGGRITEEANYEGVRVRFQGGLGKAKVSMQIDVGFGDAVVPSPTTVDYPTILDMPVPRLRGYTRESAIAEKFHAMVLLGLANSRLRDFFDVWALSKQFDFEGRVLAAAIRETFSRRSFALDPRPVVLTETFAVDGAKVAQWRGFLRRSRLDGVPTELSPIVAAIATFLLPVVEALHVGRDFELQWQAPGPWSES